MDNVAQDLRCKSKLSVCAAAKAIKAKLLISAMVEDVVLEAKLRGKRHILFGSM